MTEPDFSKNKFTPADSKKPADVNLFTPADSKKPADVNLFTPAELGISNWLYDRTIFPSYIIPGRLVSTIFHIPSAALLYWAESRVEMVQFQAAYSVLLQLTLYEIDRSEKSDPKKRVNKLNYKETNSTLTLKAIKLRKARELGQEIDEFSFQLEKPKIQSYFLPYLTKELYDVSSELGISESINRSRALIKVSIEVTKRILLGWKAANAASR